MRESDYKTLIKYRCEEASHFVAVKAELIYYIFQVAFFHSDYFKAILENSQEATSIKNKKIIGYLAL